MLGSKAGNGEVWAVASPMRIKSAALLVDRVWMPPPPEKTIGLLPWAQTWYDGFLLDPPPGTLCFTANELWDQYQWYVIEKIWNGHGGGIGMYHHALEHLDLFARVLSDIQDQVLPLYASAGEFEQTYSSNTARAYEAALVNLEIVDEKRLTWRQVQDFREDEEAVTKYRNLRLWLRDLNADSLQHAVDQIAQRVENYRWALRKHGLETRLGLLSEIIDHRTTLTAAGGLAIGAATGLDLLAPLAAGLVVAGKLVASLVTRRIERKDLMHRHESKDAAIIYDVQEL